MRLALPRRGRRIQPALRVPVAGDGAGHGDWGQVRRTVDGVPLLVADPDAYLSTVGTSASDALEDLPPGDRQHLATYLPEVVTPGPLRNAIRDATKRHVDQRVGLAVEAGCSVGCDTRTLAELADHVIAFDANVAAARVAHALTEGRPVPDFVRHEGQLYSSRDRIELPPIKNATVVVGDALDPPLHAGVADLVVAANLLDSISEPINLLGQLDAMLAPGGLLIVTSPFAWNDHITPVEQQFWAAAGGRRGPEVLRAVLEGDSPWPVHLAHDVLEQFDVPWVLRDHDRATHHYLVHVCVSRKR